MTTKEDIENNNSRVMRNKLYCEKSNIDLQLLEEKYRFNLLSYIYAQLITIEDTIISYEGVTNGKLTLEAWQCLKAWTDSILDKAHPGMDR